uniref:Uncharacterized protein n=1 Tax=Acrobeloides nanus TaxID=290746 RepID=A0A914DWA8_9BILA
MNDELQKKLELFRDLSKSISNHENIAPYQGMHYPVTHSEHTISINDDRVVRLQKGIQEKISEIEDFQKEIEDLFAEKIDPSQFNEADYTPSVKRRKSTQKTEEEYKSNATSRRKTTFKIKQAHKKTVEFVGMIKELQEQFEFYKHVKNGTL